MTVVVITRDRCAELVRALGHLIELPEQPPLIVVDNGSTDATVRTVRSRFPSVDVVALGTNLAAAGRTIGVRRATTPYVAFADDDSWWAPGALPTAERLLDAHPRLAVIAARTLVGLDERPDAVGADMAVSPLGFEPGLPGPSILGFIACGAVVRRDAYLAVGGFSARFGVGGEETMLAWDLARAGWSLVYVDSVVAHHHPSPVRDVAARRRREVRNALWASWLRRPLPVVARQTAAVARRALTDDVARGGLLDAVKGLLPVLADRRMLPPAVERRARLVERGSA